jgi:RHS repeat-associated protein
MNQLTAMTKPTGEAVSYTYDANGNRLTRTENGVMTDKYAWDVDNRLISVAKSGNQRWDYRYDYRTRRNRITEGTGNSTTFTPTKTTTLVFNGGTSVAEFESATGPTTAASARTVEYLRGPDLGGGIGGMLYSLRSNRTQPRYAYADARGDVVAQADSSGTLTWTASYEAWGTRKLETGTNADRQRANTKEEDPTGLLNEGFRYRDLETGSWLSRDPAGFVDGPNLYAYVKQNPWTGFDPLGLADRKDTAGHVWKGTGQHITPVSVGGDPKFGWSSDAKTVFDKSTIPTPNGHNMTGHGAQGYNGVAKNEMATFLEKEIGGINVSHLPAGEQVKLAEKFDQHMKSGANAFIKEFNDVVGSGPAAVEKFMTQEGGEALAKKMLSKDGGLLAKGLKLLGRAGQLLGKVDKAAPIIGGIVAGASSAAQGKNKNEVAADIAKSMSNADLLEDATNHIVNPYLNNLTDLKAKGQQTLDNDGIIPIRPIRNQSPPRLP